MSTSRLPGSLQLIAALNMPAFFPSADHSLNLPYPSSGSLPGNSPAKWSNAFGSQYPVYPSAEDSKLLAMISQQNILRSEPPPPYYQAPAYTPISGMQQHSGPSMMAQAPMDMRFCPPPTYEDRQPTFRAYEPQPKEEKATGGVSSKLDYGMEQMTDFVVAKTVQMYVTCPPSVASANQPSLNYAQAPQPEFRKWVLQVLHATRLPSATILLSLTYVNQRFRQVSSQSRVICVERDLYLFLIIGLMLGSKFLDDNTFQNKSWAEVSNLSVTELGQEERKWLVAFGHRLHIDPEAGDGFAFWQRQWNDFKTPSARVQPVLRPINSNIHRYGPIMNEEAYAGNLALKFRPEDATFESWSEETKPRSMAAYGPWLNSMSDRSPSTAPHTGPSTPDYYPGWEARGFTSQNFCGPTLTYPSDISLFENFGSASLCYGSNEAGWNCHGSTCHCATCLRSQGQARYAPVVVSS